MMKSRGEWIQRRCINIYRKKKLIWYGYDKITHEGRWIFPETECIHLVRGQENDHNGQGETHERVGIGKIDTRGKTDTWGDSG